jgi:sugar phosphate isomerase/epimerase
VNGTLRSVADLGYREVELPGFDTGVHVIQERLKHYKLNVPSMHAGYDRLRGDFDAVVKEARTLGAAFLVCPWIDLKERQTADDWKGVCQTLNKIGKAARNHGVTLAYHNHDFEFVPFATGMTPFDLLLRETDPTDVKVELDVYWAAKAGRDPVRCLKESADRVRLVHLKDMAADGSITELDAGVLALEQIIRSALSAGVKHFFVEQDDPHDPLHSIGVSLQFLRRLPPDVRPQSET